MSLSSSLPPAPAAARASPRLTSACSRCWCPLLGARERRRLPFGGGGGPRPPCHPHAAPRVLRAARARGGGGEARARSAAIQAQLCNARGRKAGTGASGAACPRACSSARASLRTGTRYACALPPAPPIRSRRNLGSTASSASSRVMPARLMRTLIAASAAAARASADARASDSAAVARASATTRASAAATAASPRTRSSLTSSRTMRELALLPESGTDSAARLAPPRREDVATPCAAAPSSGARGRPAASRATRARCAP